MEDGKPSTPPTLDASWPPTKVLPYEHVHFVDTFAGIYVCSVLSATNSELLTFPLDLLKTRLQIQGEVASEGKMKTVPYRGMTAMGLGVVKEEGFFKLWQGMTPMLYRHCVYTGARILLFDYFRRTFAQSEGGKNLTFWHSAFFGATAGMVAQGLASPCDLLKIHFQTEGRRRLLGEAPRPTSTMEAFKTIYNQGGIKGLWKGNIPNMQRAALVNLGDLTAYDVTKRLLLQDLGMAESPLVHILASISAGFVATVMSTPADVIKSRVMNQPTDSMGRGLLYKGSIDCLRQAVNNEGILSLYKGFVPCWIRLAPWALVFWVSFEQLRLLFGGTGF